MTSGEAINWLINITADIGKAKHRDLWHYEQALSEIREILESEPERKTGKWIQKSKPLDFCTEWWYECSECGSKPPNDRYGHPNYLTDFCPDCGADMRGEQDG